MANPTLKAIRNASKKEISKLLRKHIGDGKNQMICKEAYEQLISKIKDEDDKSSAEKIKNAISSLSPDNQTDWCVIVNIIANSLEADNKY